jgi:hypothetical protein
VRNLELEIGRRFRGRVLRVHRLVCRRGLSA